MGASKPVVIVSGLVGLAALGWYANNQGWLSGISNGAGEAVAIDADDIGGVVTGPNGPEAGVWVIAETDDLPTRFVRSVVTDDQGRYVIPDLPDATYQIFSRGYGLIDSEKAVAAPGSQVNLSQEAAPDAATAAKIYPGLYWYALLGIPAADEFPGTGDGGNGIAPTVENREQWLHHVKTTGCYSCHQLGSEYTRTLPASLGDFESSVEAWTRRIQSGQASGTMVGAITRMGPARALGELADWTDRIAEGEVPFDAPERPRGVERNVVVTQWDWSEPQFYMHDLIASDRRDPTVNANGKLFGSPENSTDQIPILDPVSHVATNTMVPLADPATPSTLEDPMFQPSPIWGAEPIWDSHSVTHNPMMDHLGRVWLTSRVKPNANPDFCRAGSDHPSAQLMPLNNSGRDLSLYDPANDAWTLIPTCFSTHHLNFTEDGTHTIWFSAGGPNNAGAVIGWFNTATYDETGDYEAAQGWTTFVLDTNGNGLRDPDPVAAEESVDPARDKILHVGNYSVAVSPADGSIWGSFVPFPSGYVRVIPGDNPPYTALSQYYEMPYYDENVAVKAHSIRGADIDSNGVMWAGTQSGHIASFDVRKCTAPLNGPEATGRHCPEGWSFLELPGPNFKDMQEVSGSVETSYYSWVDQHDTFGLGNDVPIVIGNASGSLHMVVNEEIVTFTVPYPLGFFAKGVDGRIDDPLGGWKGRGLWTTSGDRTPAHMETGPGTRPKVYNFKLRPDPLAH
jgi:hypothetical protein